MRSGKFSLTSSRPREFIDITNRLAEAVAACGQTAGVCCVYNPHTTAGLTINEGADPDVQTDLLAALERMVPRDLTYRHQEGNSPAHLMATLVGSSVSVPFAGGRLRLGTWQRIFFGEFDGPRSRQVYWQIL